MNDKTPMATLTRVVVSLLAWIHLTSSTMAIAQDTAPPPVPNPVMIPPAWLAGSAMAQATVPDPPATPDEAPSAPVEPRLGMPMARSDAIADKLEQIGNLARRVRATGMPAPDRAQVASARGDADPMLVAKDILALVQQLGDFEPLVVQQWQEEAAQMQRFGVPAEIASRSSGLIATFQSRASNFRAVIAQLQAAYGANARDDTAAALLVLADQLAQQDNARGFRSIDKARLPMKVARAADTPAPDVDESQPPRAITAVFDPPTAADLAQTTEVQFTAEIRALAQELGNNPVAIRNWVYDHIEFQPTHGSIQGAALTLLNRSGNALDIASLTIAILRAANVPARYVYGSVELPEDKVRNWLGNVPTPAMAIDLLQKGQVPAAGTVVGGQIRAIRFEHVWVEAYVDFIPSRGARNVAPDQWVPLDGSYKQFEYDAPVDWRQRTDPGFRAAAQAFAQDVTVGADGGITGFDFDTLDASLQQVARDAAGDIVGGAPGTTPADLYERREIIPAGRVMLEGTLPYLQVSQNVLRFTSVPASLQHVLRIAFYADQTSFNYDNPTRVADVVLARVGARPLVVDYPPATAADAAAIAQYAANNSETIALGSVNVLTQVKLGDDVVLDAGSARMGTQHLWTVDIKATHGSQTVTEAYKFAAGTKIDFVPNAAGVTPERAEREFADVPERGQVPIADMLYAAATTFWMLHDRVDSEGARSLGGRALRLSSIGAFAAPMQVRYFFGLPRSGSYNGYTTDVKAARIALAMPNESDNLPTSLHVGAGGSLAESTSWNFVTGAPLSNPGLSATSIIRTAIDQGQPIYQITSQNVNTALAAMTLSSDAESEIRNAANAGMIIIAHKHEITNRSWSGSGYVILDVDSGSALHRVEGGLAGGINVGCLSQAVLLKVLCERMIIKKATEFLARLILRSGVAAVAQSLMVALLGPAGLAIGGVVAIVAVAVSYAMAVYEVYQWVKMIESGIENLTPEQLAELGIDNLNDVLCSYTPPCLGGGGMGGGGGGGGGGDGGGGPMVGNPVAVGTGAKWQVETDYVGAGPYPLRFVRTYASAIPRAASEIGAKWTATYFMRLRLPPQLDGSAFPPTERPDSVLLMRADGGWFQYNWRSTGYVGDGNIPGKLTRDVTAGSTTGWRYVNIDDETEHYDAQGKLLSISSRAGLTHTLAYDPQDRLASVTDRFGRAITFHYDAGTGYLSHIVDPMQRTTSYQHDDRGNLVRVTYPDTRSRQYHYENLVGLYLLTGITDERGIRTSSWRYDAQGRVTLAERAGGVDRYTFEYGRLSTTMVDPLGKVRTYQFALKYDRPYLASSTEPCSSCGGTGSSLTTYDGAGYIASVTDFNGNRTTYTRDARGLVTSMTEAAGTAYARTVSTQWHPQWRLPTRITEPTAAGTRVTLLGYDERGNLLTQKTTVGSESRLTTWTYDADGQVLTEDGPRVDVDDRTVATYDEDGNRATLRDALDHVTRYTQYDAAGNLLERVAPDGLRTTYAYDARDRVRSVTRLAADSAVPEVDRYDYDETGNIVKLTEAGGHVVTIPHDGANRPTGSIDGLGHAVAYTLDGAGNVTRAETRDADDTVVAVETRRYDDLGRLLATGDAAGNESIYGYDDNGNETSVRDALDHVTGSTYDPLDRLLTVTDADLQAVTLSHDPDDNVRTITDARSLVTRYTRNGYGELTAVQSPDAGTSGFEYDAGGNLVRSRDARNKTADFTYDALDRPTRIAYEDERIDLVYDAAAGGAGAALRLTSATVTPLAASTTSVASSESLIYDGHGRVTSRTQTVGAVPTAATTRTSTYTWLAEDKIDTATLPSGAQVRYGYGADGRVVSISVNGVVVVREIEYFPMGEVKSWRYGSGSARYARVFDDDGRIVGHDAGDTTRTLGYDTVGRIDTIADAGADPTSVWAYDYSATDRLVGARNAATTGPLAQRQIAWRLDASGNRLDERSGIGALPPAPTTTYTIASDSNRLAAVAGDPRQYDAAGNATRWVAQRGDFIGSTIDATIGARGRVQLLRIGGVPIARYAYDSNGLRIAKWTGADAASVDGAPTRQFTYDDDDQLTGEYDGTGALVAEHLWVGETPVAVIVPPTGGHGGMIAGAVAVLFVHPDHLDTPRAIVNDAAQVAWRWDAPPFGDADAQSQPGVLPAFVHGPRLPGQYFDPESGLHYNVARDYDPATGRYASVDPLGLDAGINPYAYALGSPLDISDASGEFPRLPKFPKPKPPKPKPNPARCTGPNVHPNCREYKGNCYVYRINAPDGSLWKYGESCKPRRCERQIAKLNRGKPPGAPRYTCDKIKDFCTKGDARDYENGKITDYKKANCGCRPPGNKNDH